MFTNVSKLIINLTLSCFMFCKITAQMKDVLKRTGKPSDRKMRNLDILSREM